MGVGVLMEVAEGEGLQEEGGGVEVYRREGGCRVEGEVLTGDLEEAEEASLAHFHTYFLLNKQPPSLHHSPSFHHNLSAFPCLHHSFYF